MMVETKLSFFFGPARTNHSRNVRIASICVWDNYKLIISLRSSTTRVYLSFLLVALDVYGIFYECENVSIEELEQLVTFCSSCDSSLGIPTSKAFSLELLQDRNEKFAHHWVRLLMTLFCKSLSRLLQDSHKNSSLTMKSGKPSTHYHGKS